MYNDLSRLQAGQHMLSGYREARAKRSSGRVLTPVTGAPSVSGMVFVALIQPVPGAQSSAVVVQSFTPDEVLQTTTSTASAGTPV